ncbi:MAG TPA: prolyl oligopeptidase family serine peptidase [Candidatus Solibacter sp.]|nr:prolyl oligopeptidase family serine peptidase [Candidatus Solibacter sp.]
MRKLSLAFLLLAFQARPANNFALTIDNIMRGPGLVGYEPTAVRWSHDSATIYFQWKRYTDPVIAPLDTYAVNRDGGNLRKLTDDEIKLLPPTVGDTTRDKRLTVSSNVGDLYLYDNTTGKQRQLTKTVDTESNPRFTRDEKRISYMHTSNLYVMGLDGGSLVQLTDIRSATAPTTIAAPIGGGRGFGGGGGRGQGGGGRGAAAAEAGASTEQKGTDSQEYLKKEQRELIQVVRERVELREEQQKKREKESQRKPFALQARQSAGALQLTPDEKYVIASVFESTATPAKNTIVPNYITDSAYTEDIPGRSNVGDSQGATKLAIINVETGEVKWVDHGQKKVAPATDDRDIQLAMPVWNEDGTKAVIAGRAADNKDRWIFALDLATAKLRVLYTLHDDAWVGGPASTALGWMKNDRDVYFVSEKSGFAHLWAVPFEGGEPRALTSGNWEVIGVRQSRDKAKFFLTATADGPADQYLYEMPAEGGSLLRISNAPGKHITTLSPDDRWIADIYSYTNKPPDLYVQENNLLHQELKRLTTSPSPDFAQYAWQDAPIVQIPARDGVKVPARLYKPASYKKSGRAVIFVHGAGYLQNVDHKWSTYYREYMFHHILEERGFLVLDVDYRGSAGYGRDWRAAIYQHMGGKDLDDIVDAAKYAVSTHGADPKKIGLYGGSYGGFITLMAMFTASDTFTAGAALRPVTDWATYNHGYTSDILNTPQLDPQAYRRSSPIFFAEGLKGTLLICHGMVDTNVEFQDTVRLIQRLIELRKENWSVAPYPVEDHTFVQSTSWADEYKRILKLFETSL